MTKKSVNILLVEDDPYFIRLFQSFLYKRRIYTIEFKIIETERLSDALKLLNDEKFDILLLDLHLPDSKGVNTFNRVKEENFDLPIIILTFLDDEDFIFDCLKDGAQDFILKNEVNEYILKRAVLHSIERYELQRQLVNSREDLERFSYIVAHDIKNPLQSLSTTIARMELYYNKGNIDKILSLINKMKEKIFNIGRLVNNILYYSLSMNKKQISEPFSLHDSVKDALNNLSEKISISSAKINYDSLPIVYGNPMQITQLFQNLLENAIKYKNTELQPIINISYEKKDEFMYVISIKDNGKGINLDDNKNVFHVFKQIDSKISGFGVGLAICKNIVEKHKGEIWIEKNPDQGVTFNFTLPYVDIKN